MTDFGKWIRLDYAACETTEYRLLANLAAQLHEVAKGYMEWEADMVLDSGVWRSGDGLPHLTQNLQDKLMALQEKRTAALDACKKFQEKYGHE